MCDTMVAAGGQSIDGAVLFGKNSDRERNEAQFLETLPAKTHRKGSKVKLTHVEIEQAPETHAVLLSKPFWIWGPRSVPTSMASSSATRRSTASACRR